MGGYVSFRQTHKKREVEREREKDVHHMYSKYRLNEKKKNKATFYDQTETHITRPSPSPFTYLSFQTITVESNDYCRITILRHLMHTFTDLHAYKYISHPFLSRPMLKSPMRPPSSSSSSFSVSSLVCLSVCLYVCVYRRPAMRDKASVFRLYLRRCVREEACYHLF